MLIEKEMPGRAEPVKAAAILKCGIEVTSRK
jgi:hypothetical protein